MGGEAAGVAAEIGEAGRHRRLKRAVLALALFGPLAALAQLQVSASGTLVATLDVVAPPGVAGVQPAIALTYKGVSVDSEIGHGWQLAGLSVITRCGGTKAIDGLNPVPGNVAFNSNDKLCLDGERLIPTNMAGGQAKVGAATGDAAGQGLGSYTEYRTENDRYARIRSYGVADGMSADSGPLYFRIWTKDGHILQYGNWSNNDTNAVVGSSPAWSDGSRYAQSWALARSTDRFGNNVDFKYDQGDTAWGSTVRGNANGHWWHISEIQYSGNKIVFGYSLLPTTSPQLARETYFYGSKNLVLHSLDTITTYVNSPNTTLGKGLNAVAVRTYNLHKSVSAISGRPLLKYVQECAGDVGSTKCLPYSTYTYGAADSATPQLPEVAAVPNFVLAKENMMGVVYGNFMGTGRTDIMTFAWTSAGGDNYLYADKLWMNAGSGFFNAGLGVGAGGNFNLTAEIMGDAIGCFSYEVADFNNDGLPDILRYAGKYWQQPITTDVGFPSINSGTCPTTESTVIFFNNGDGSFTKTPIQGVTLKKQVMVIIPSLAHSNHVQFFEGDQFYVIDVNGDGIPDLVQTMFPSVGDWYFPANSADPCASMVCTHVYIGDGKGNFTEQATNIANLSLYGFGDNNFVEDVDGDGRADIVQGNQNFLAGSPASLMNFGVRSRGNGDFDVLPSLPCLHPDKAGWCHQTMIDYDGSGVPGRLYPGTASAADNKLYAASSKSDMATEVTNSNLGTDPTIILGSDPYPYPTTFAGFQVGDFNGDGRQDILASAGDKSKNRLYLSNGDGTFTLSPATSFTQFSLSGYSAPIWGYKTPSSAIDLMGDGSTQLLSITWDEVHDTWSNALLVPKLGPMWSIDTLSGQTLPSGDKYSVSYTTLTANTSQLGGPVYKSDRVAGVPETGNLIDISGPIQVVSQLSVPDGIGGQLTEYYFYRGLKVDKLLGNVGYRQTIVQKPAKDGTWLTTLTDYAQTAPYLGMPVSVKTYHGQISEINDSNLLTWESSLYCDQLAGTAAASAAISSGVNCAPVGALKQPFLLQKVVKNFDDGFYPMPTVTSTMSVNANGDPTTVVTSTTLSGTSSDTYTTTTTNGSFTADKTDCGAFDTCNWLLGRPQTLTVEKTAPTTMLTTSAGTAAGATATTGTASGSVDVLTKALAFGTVQTGSTLNLTAYVTSDGTSAITFPSQPTVGSGVFSFVSTTCGASLAPNTACAIVVRFAPTAVGAANGVLTVPTNGGTLTASLSGSGQAPSLVLDHVNPSASGWTMPAYSSSTLGVYLRNTGIGPVTINSVNMPQGIAYTDSSAGSCGPNNVIAAGAICWILPGWGGAAGTVSGTLTVVSTAGTLSTNLSAIQKSLDMSVSGNAPSTKTTANLTVTVTNNTVGNFTFGAPALHLNGLSGQGTFSLLTNNCPAVLAANGGSCTMVVQYAAGPLAGAASVSASPYGTFEFQDMFDGASVTGSGRYRGGPADVASLGLSATTLRGNLNLSATSLSYGNQTVGLPSATQSVLVVNNSTSAAVTFSGISVSAGSSDFTQTNNCPASLAYASSCNIVVTFTPSVAGARTGAISIASDGSGPSSISLSGTAVAAPSVTGIAFGSTSVTAGQNVAMNWSTTNATSVAVNCTGAGTYSYTGATVNGGGTVVASATPGTATCSVTAYNAAGTAATATNAFQVVAAPSVTGLTFGGAYATVGNAMSMNWSTANATSVAVNCTGAGSYSYSGPTVNYNGAVVGTPTAGTATCAVTAYNAAGSSASTSNTFQVVAAPAVTSVTLSPNVVFAGSSPTLAWATSNASSVAVSCVAPATFSYSGTTVNYSYAQINTSGTGNGTCTVTASNAAGSTATGSATVSVIARPTMTSSLAFGNVRPNTTSTLVATLTNNATVPLAMTAPTASAVQSTYYSFGGTTCGTVLAAGLSCSVSVNFTPTVLVMGANGTVTISTSVGNFYATLSGNGAQSQLSFSPGTLAYGSVPVQTPTSTTTTLTNTGNLATTALAFSPDTYTSVSGCTSQLAPGGTCTLTVTLTPNNPNNTSGSIGVSSGNGPSASLPWTATPSGPNLAGYGGAGGMPPSLFVGQSATSQFSIINAGNVTAGGLTLKWYDGIGGAAFSVDPSSTCGTSLAPGAICTYVTRMTAQSSGTASDQWVVSSTTPGSMTLVEGGYISTIYAEPTFSSAAFGAQTVNTAATKTVTFSNPGSIALPMTTPSAPFVSGTGFSFVGTTCSSSLAANSSCTVTIQFLPTAQSIYSGTLIFSAGGGNFGASLSGTGAPTLVPFTSNNGAQTTIFTNPNSVAVTPTSSGLTWTSGTGYAAVSSNTCTGSVAAHGTCTITYTAPTPDCKLDAYSVESYVTISAGTAYGAVVSKTSSGKCL